MLLESGEKDRAGVLFIVSADTLSVYKAFADVKRLSLRNAILESSLTDKRVVRASAFGGDAARKSRRFASVVPQYDRESETDRFAAICMHNMGLSPHATHAALV